MRDFYFSLTSSAAWEFQSWQGNCCPQRMPFIHESNFHCLSSNGKGERIRYKCPFLFREQLQEAFITSAHILMARTQIHSFNQLQRRLEKKSVFGQQCDQLNSGVLLQKGKETFRYLWAISSLCHCVSSTLIFSLLFHCYVLCQ